MDRQGWGAQRKSESLGWAGDFLEETSGRILHVSSVTEIEDRPQEVPSPALGGASEQTTREAPGDSVARTQDKTLVGLAVYSRKASWRRRCFWLFCGREENGDASGWRKWRKTEMWKRKLCPCLSFIPERRGRRMIRRREG